MPPENKGEKLGHRTPLTLNGWLDQSGARRILLWTVALLSLCSGLGWYLTHLLGHVGEDVERRALLTTVTSLVGTFQTQDEVEAIKSLRGVHENLGTAGYADAHEKLQNIRKAIPASRFAYLISLKDGDVMFLADSEPSTSPDYSPPGQVYGEASDDLRGVFLTKVPTTEGPVADRWGTWVSGLAPIVDPETGAVIAVLGVDINAETWESTINWFRRVGLGVSGAVAAIILIAGAFSMRDRWLASKLAVANRIVENSATLLFRVAGGPGPPLTFVSRNIARLGYDPRELTDSPLLYLSLIHPDDRQRAESLLRSLFEGSDIAGMRLRLRAKNDDYHWFEGEVRSRRDTSGQLLSAEGLLNDISKQKEAEDKLVFANTLLNTQFENAPDGILVVDKDRRVILFNQRFAEIFDIGVELALGNDDSIALKRAIELSTDPKAFLERILCLYAHPEESASDEFETKDGRIFERQTAPLKAGDGRILGRIWFIHDISGLKKAQRRAQDDLLRSQEQLRITGEISKSVALLSGDVDALARQVTELASQTSGCERVNVWLFNGDETELHCIDLYEATLARHSAGMVLSEKEFGPELKIVKSSRYVNADDALTDPRMAGYVEPYLKPLGITSMLDVSIRASEHTLGLLCFEHVGKPHHWTEDEIGFACQVADKIGIAVISRMRRQAEEQIRHSARHDGLTGLANRKVFIEGVEQAIAYAERSEKSFAVLYLDLDHFKDVNDTLGHPVGDELLCAAAERLRQCVRKTDLVARFGGDEFALLTEGMSDPAEVANLAAKVIAALNEPYPIAGNDIKSGVSVGIAVREAGENDPELLLSNADIALYRAKSEERGSYRFFTEAMDTEVRARVTLSGELRKAIDAGELFLEYQPQVDLETGRIVGVEALVRWRHPGRGVLAPGEFIPIAEQTGLIGGVDGWVLREVCRQGKAWVDEGIAPDTIALNMSAVSFKRPAEVEQHILVTLAETGLPPERLEIEITESGLMAVSREQEAVLSRLRGKGISFAIDDFGTGYSSLSYLRRFPVHRLKIAQVFITQIVTDPGSEAIVRAVVGLSRQLGMMAIAEGVESEKQLAMVEACGCKEVQGYYFSKPLNAKDIRPILSRGRILRPAPAKTAA